MYLYLIFGAESLFLSILLLIIGGALINGPYALITTAVAQNLGQDPSLKGSTRAVATVSAIIDGTGSIGVL